MILLLEVEKLNMNDVSDRMDLNRSTATKIMYALLKEGYIIKERDKKDGRVLYVYLTDKGKALAKEFKDQMKDYYAKVMENLSGFNLKEAADSIMKIEQAVESV